MRRGLKEGLLMRLLLLAPYRCKECHARFFGFSGGLIVLPTRKRHKSLAGYFGLHGADARRVQRTLGIIAISLILLFIAVSLVRHLST